MFWPLFHCFFALSPFAAILRFQFNSKRVSVWLLFVFVSDFVLARRDQAKLTSKSADFCRCAISVTVCVCVSRRIEEQVRLPARWAVGRRTVFGASNCNSVCCCCFILFRFFVAFYVCRTRKFALRRIIQRHKSDINTNWTINPPPSPTSPLLHCCIDSSVIRSLTALFCCCCDYCWFRICCVAFTRM